MIERLPEERTVGLHSGIPECCVEAYMSGRGALDLEQRTYDLGIGYVPCPDCEAKILSGASEPAPVHICRPGASLVCAAWVESRIQIVLRGRESA